MSEDEIYHLIDLLEMDIDEMQYKILLPLEVKKKNTEFNEALIKKLKEML